MFRNMSRNQQFPDVTHSKTVDLPWAKQRTTRNGPQMIQPSNHLWLADNVAIPAIPAVQYDYREFKALPMDHPVILEPIQHHRESSWMDWMPDLFGEDKNTTPGPLIGPINFPGMGNQVYVRQTEPIDEDTDHVVIHLINRLPPTQNQQFTSPQFLQSSEAHNPLAYFMKDPVGQLNRYLTHFLYFCMELARGLTNSYKNVNR